MPGSAPIRWQIRGNDMISMNKKYQTRDGQPVEIVTTSARDSPKWPVMGYIGDQVNFTFWSPKGIHDVNGRRSSLDLVEVEVEVEVTLKRVLWLNVYPGGIFVHDSREYADKCSTENRIACLKVEFEEGQFDE